MRNVSRQELVQVDGVVEVPSWLAIVAGWIYRAIR